MARSDKIAVVLFLFFLLKVCSQPRTSHSLVKFLPGFEGPLPFELETGYVDVEESDDVQLFYYFVESERNPGEDPLLLWLTGGPGCSGLSGLVYEIVKSLKRSCRGEYQNINPSNVECQKDLQYYTKCISGIETTHILEPLCSFASPKPQEMYARRRYLDEHQKELLDPEPPILPKFGCRTYSFLLSSYWANDGNVQKAIHIRKGSIGQWKRCDFGLPYTVDLPSSFLYHVNLSTRGYRALVYSGDHDMLVPFLGTEAWIKSLNYPIVDDWRPWMVQDQVAGYTRTYSNQMTYATIKGGGHTAPEYKPAECFAMFKRWISREPL